MDGGCGLGATMNTMSKDIYDDMIDELYPT